jgi:hypothetical protein
MVSDYRRLGRLPSKIQLMERAQTHYCHLSVSQVPKSKLEQETIFLEYAGGKAARLMIQANDS